MPHVIIRPLSYSGTSAEKCPPTELCPLIQVLTSSRVSSDRGSGDWIQHWRNLDQFGLVALDVSRPGAAHIPARKNLSNGNFREKTVPVGLHGEF